MATTYGTFLDPMGPPRCRSDFLSDARCARIEEPLGNMRDVAKFRAVCSCVEWRWAEEGRLSPLSGARPPWRYAQECYGRQGHFADDREARPYP